MAVVCPNPVEPDSQPFLAVRVRGRLSRDFSLEMDFSAPPGINILFGASGSGKTTVLNYVAGLATPDEGRISLGADIFFDSAAGIHVSAHSRRIGYVFQDLALFPHLTVAGNLGYGLAAIPHAERARRIDAILDSFRISHLRRERPGNISGGERQRVAIGRALVTDPCALLLDEPLTALDRPTRSRLIQDLRAWNQSHSVPILYVTHSREEVFALGERVTVLDQGRIAAQGSPYEVLRAPRQELTAELAGVQNIFDAIVIALHEPEGSMTCECGAANGEAPSPGPRIEVPLTRGARPGSAVRIGIHAGDILLATSVPANISARNIIPGRIESLTQQDVAVVAIVNCGLNFEVHITPAAQHSLGLAPGVRVWLVIKTYSCHLLQ